jgi:pilus assembly protein CpaE
VLQIFGKSLGKSKAILQICLVAHDPASGELLRKAVLSSDGVNLKTIDSQSVKPGALVPDIGVFLYDLDITSEDSMADFDRFMRSRPPEIPVIVLSPTVDDELVRWFLRLRVADWLKVPLSPGELIAACGRALSIAQSGRTEVKCFTFVSARGGAGASTLAIHAAQIMAARGASPSPTLLVDLNLADSSCAEYLDVQPGWQVEELIPDPTRLDRRMLDVMTVKHKCGIHLLAAQRNLFAPRAPVEDVVTNTLDLTTQVYQNLIIDLPRQMETWSDPVILGSGVVYIVTDFTVPGLRVARRYATEMSSHFGGEVTPRVIVNKYHRSLFGSSLSSHEVKKVLGDSFAGLIPAEESLLREAIDRGVPTTDIKPKNAIITELAKIIAD